MQSVFSFTNLNYIDKEKTAFEDLVLFICI